MKKIDKFILGKCQSVSDWVQDFAGITNFFIVKYIISTILVLNETWYVIFRSVIKEEGDIFMYVGSVIVIYFATARLPTLVEKIETLVSANPTFKNPLEELVADFRQQQALPIIIFFLTFNGVFYVSLVFTMNIIIFWTCALCLIYFLCCTPKPPSKSKLKKAIEKAKSIRISLPQSSPGLSPG